MFSGCTVPPDSKETKLQSSNQEASPSAGKNTGVILVPFGGVDISEVPRFHLLHKMSSQWGLQKLLQGFVSHELTAYLFIFLFLTYLNLMNYGHIIKSI